VFSLTGRRVTTGAKSRLPLLRTMLGIMPRTVLNLLRRLEHRLVTARRVHHARRQQVDHADVTAIGDHRATVPPAERSLIADDAVDSGVMFQAFPVR
jgi:hypothetical protein